jgi:uncharacterized small protein (DUF1192 family)
VTPSQEAAAVASVAAGGTSPAVARLLGGLLDKVRRHEERVAELMAAGQAVTAERDAAVAKLARAADDNGVLKRGVVAVNKARLVLLGKVAALRERVALAEAQVARLTAENAALSSAGNVAMAMLREAGLLDAFLAAVAAGGGGDAGDGDGDGDGDSGGAGGGEDYDPTGGGMPPGPFDDCGGGGGGGGHDSMAF